MPKFLLAAALLGAPLAFAQAQTRDSVPVYTHADTLHGAIDSPGRNWWDVTFYDLHTTVTPADSSIRGRNAITYRVLSPGTTMQIDLQMPLLVDSMVEYGHKVKFKRDGNAFFVTPPRTPKAGEVATITVYYHGHPQAAKRPPWSGGYTWATDSLKRPWIVTTDQGIGASIWWPNKDSQADEPDSQRVALTVPSPLMDVSNGRLRSTKKNADGTTTYEWFVVNPINNYAIAVAAGHYAHYSDVFHGEKGDLTLDYWPLDYHVDAAHIQFPQSVTMLACFEHWFGPYPWYEDGYKLIEVPNNGMEHQSAVAYGNLYANGYKGRDGTGTGLGMKWDFIIVHESAHEWFGNNITSKDVADMWVHESFANYAEGLYTECQFGKKAGEDYIVGNRRLIRNDKPIIPAYGVNAQGSGDMYPKGGDMLHTIRQIVGDDEKWRGTLRGLNQHFWHQTVTGKQVQEYISEHTEVNLSKVFEQYLTTTKVPVFEYHITGDSLAYRWTDVISGFDMPVRVTLSDSTYSVIRPTEEWQKVGVALSSADKFAVDRNYYVVVKEGQD